MKETNYLSKKRLSPFTFHPSPTDYQGERGEPFIRMRQPFI